MSERRFARWLAGVSVIVLAGLSSCFAEPDATQAGTGGKGSMPASGGNGATGALGFAGEDIGAGAAPPSMGGMPEVCAARELDESAECRKVVSAHPYHTKLVKDEPQPSLAFVDDLFLKFKAHCGSCHVDTNLGGFKVTPQTFTRVVDQKVVDAIQSNIETCPEGDEQCVAFMPPVEANGRPWSEREGNKSDPVNLFVQEIQAWLSQSKDGKPPDDVYTLPAELSGKSPYPVDEAFASASTSLGTCVPDAGMVATEPNNACDIDARFAAMQRDTTSPTLVDRIGLPLTLDQTDLFTLDSAELAKFGVISYSPAYPLWTDDAGKQRYIRVPRGTSVKYVKETKTFDIPENTRFYKTFLKKVKVGPNEYRYRKIETRVIVSRDNGQSLFGTYEWNNEETNATLVTSPLRNGEPFTDVLKTIITDEPLAAEIQRKKEAGEVRNVTYELDRQHAVRRYAIPGSERCIQCHMGNPDFVLAFSPLQVNHRPCDQATLDKQGYCEGGIIETTDTDEVSQLQRLIDYGVITGYDEEPLKLEDSQGARKARSPEELIAQGYLLGNCAHCHNPTGYPTKQNPELEHLLDFLPSEAGGVFEFPLDRTSPRIKRGQLGEISLPYITPSLRDIMVTPVSDRESVKWLPKQVASPDGKSVDFIDAPWRSLIYRNVDTPFTYTDNYAIYPHMPLNSPGFDCRAPRILAEWMTSIPAVKKRPELSEDFPVVPNLTSPNQYGGEIDPQPYLEVKPGEPRFEYAQEQAKKKLAEYRKGNRYHYCPDTSDIVDIDVVRGLAQVPRDIGAQSSLGLPGEGVPDRSHWVVTDLTEPPGEWSPRRTDWEDVLVNGNVPPHGVSPSSGGVFTEAEAARNAQLQVVEMLQSITLTDAFKTFGKTKMPFGVWQSKPECATKLAKQPKLSEYASGGSHANERLRWMDDNKNQDLSGSVYQATPGESIYRMICINCHGANADSKGRQASTLQDMTGGTGRVANFRDGLFGPTGSHGANRARVFNPPEWSPRYLPWMALGGTLTKIPQAILDLVANTQVLGVSRDASVGNTASANMLQVAQNLCYGVANVGALGSRPISPTTLFENRGWTDLNRGSGLIVTNGDAELWHHVCARDNPPPIRALQVGGTEESRNLTGSEFDLYWPASYPATAAIGDDRGRSQPQLKGDNIFPWCVVAPSDPSMAEWVAAQKTFDQKPLPICPAEFLTAENQFKVELDDQARYHYPDAQKWALRGAINAGLAVFVYLDDLIGNDTPANPRFNECELLSE
jgi:mono/diheme cytochrome c family protein